MSFTPGPWKMLESKDALGNTCGYAVWPDLERPYSDSPRGNRICATPDGTTPENLANARLISAAPDLYAAVNSADTAFAVLNVQDLGGQARKCIREAWPLVQQARAKVNPDGVYAEAVKEAQEHEIKRLDGIVEELRAYVEFFMEHFDRSINPDEALRIEQFMIDHFPS